MPCVLQLAGCPNWRSANDGDVAPFGSDQRQDKTLDLRHAGHLSLISRSVSSLGIRPRRPQVNSVLASEVRRNSAASKAGLQAGDRRIVKVDGQPLTQWMKFVTFVRDNPGKPLALQKIERRERLVSLTLTPDTKSVNGRRRKGLQAWCLKLFLCRKIYKTIRQYGPFSAILEATDKTWQKLMKRQLVCWVN